MSRAGERRERREFEVGAARRTIQGSLSRQNDTSIERVALVVRIRIGCGVVWRDTCGAVLPCSFPEKNGKNG